MIAKLVAADEDTVWEVIHRFNEIGLACLDPQSIRKLAAYLRTMAVGRSGSVGKPCVACSDAWDHVSAHQDLERIH